MGAGEEARSRQYKGTAMSDDEASKVNRWKAFGFPKATQNKKQSPSSKDNGLLKV